MDSFPTRPQKYTFTLMTSYVTCKSDNLYSSFFPRSESASVYIESGGSKESGGDGLSVTDEKKLLLSILRKKRDVSNNFLLGISLQKESVTLLTLKVGFFSD